MKKIYKYIILVSVSILAIGLFSGQQNSNLVRDYITPVETDEYDLYTSEGEGTIIEEDPPDGSNPVSVELINTTINFKTNTSTEDQSKISWGYFEWREHIIFQIYNVTEAELDDSIKNNETFQANLHISTIMAWGQYNGSLSEDDLMNLYDQMEHNSVVFNNAWSEGATDFRLNLRVSVSIRSIALLAQFYEVRTIRVRFYSSDANGKWPTYTQMAHHSLYWLDSNPWDFSSTSHTLSSNIPTGSVENNLYVWIQINCIYDGIGYTIDRYYYTHLVDDDHDGPKIYTYYHKGDGTDEHPGYFTADGTDYSGGTFKTPTTYYVPNSLGSHSYTFRAVDFDNDRAGDSMTSSATVYKYIRDDDTTPPVINIQHIRSGINGDPGIWRVSATDPESGGGVFLVWVNGIQSGVSAGDYSVPNTVGNHEIRVSAVNDDRDRGGIDQEWSENTHTVYIANEGEPFSFDGIFGSTGGYINAWDFGDGTYGFQLFNPTHTYVDDGTYTVTRKLVDGNFNLVSTKSVTVIVRNVNPIPIAGSDQTVDEGALVNFLGSFTDLGIEDTHTFLWNFGDGTTAEGTLTPSHVYADNGVYTVTLTVIDDDGGVGSDTLTVTVNNVVSIAHDDNIITDEDIAVDITLSATDTEGESLIYIIVDNPLHGTLSGTGSNLVYTPDPDYFGTDSLTFKANDGSVDSNIAVITLIVNPVNDAPIASDDSATVDEDSSVSIDVLTNDSDVDGDVLTIESVGSPTFGTAVLAGGQIVYTPGMDYNGQDSFAYTISDGNGGFDTATVSVTVNAVNDAPIASDDSATTDEDTSVIIDVLANGFDVDGDTLTIASVGSPTFGTVVIAGGLIVYTPGMDYNGPDSFTYTTSDGNGGTATATVTMTVNAVNDAPIANGDSATTDEDTAIIIDVLVNDSDVDGDALTIDSVGSPTFGTVVIDGGLIVYTPGLDYNGPDSFTYTISDGNAGFDTATVSITVNAVNDAPIASDDSATTDEDTSVTIDVLANDSDVDGDALTIDSIGSPTFGIAVIDGGLIVYTPGLDYNGPDLFTYTISDGMGGITTATVTMTVNAVNDAPIANDDSAITDEDTSLTIDVLVNDSDVDGDSLTIDSVGSPSFGTTVIAGGLIVYTPWLDYNGQDSFAYTISDGNGGFDTATVSVTVNAVNDVPIASDDSATVDEDSSVSIDVLANDSDVDDDALTILFVSAPSSGTAVIDGGSIVYTPGMDYNGPDSFAYTISDGMGGTATATVTITVNAVNDIPIASDDSATVDEDSSVSIDVLANDSDVDDDALTIESVGSPTFGTAVIAGGLIVYTPELDYNGPDSFTYTTSDGNGGFDAATITVEVLDKTAPTTTLIFQWPSSGFNPTFISTNTEIILVANDNTYGTGVDITEYQVDTKLGKWFEYTSTFSINEIGDHTIYYRSIDKAGNEEITKLGLVVVNASELIYTGDVSGDYSDPVLLKANLIDIATGLGIEGKTIVFTINTQSISAITNSMGFAQKILILDQPAGAYLISALFEEDDEYLGDIDEHAFTINKEFVYAEYTGDMVVPLDAEFITLRATVFDEDDGNWGNLSKIWVNITIWDSTLFTPLDTYEYILQVDITIVEGVGIAEITIPNPFLVEDGYFIQISFEPGDNDHYWGDTTDFVTLIIYEPTGDFVTGGGWIEDSNGNKGNFGFNVKYKKNGLPKGQLLYIYREGDYIYIFKANAWVGMAIISDDNYTIFEAKCNVKKIYRPTGEIVFEDGNYRLIIEAWDHSEDGKEDIIQIRVYDKIGIVFHEAGFDPFGFLRGGNIVIHIDEKA